jgi:hypothetical protein
LVQLNIHNAWLRLDRCHFISPHLSGQTYRSEHHNKSWISDAPKFPLEVSQTKKAAQIGRP